MQDFMSYKLHDLCQDLMDVMLSRCLCQTHIMCQLDGVNVTRTGGPVFTVCAEKARLFPVCEKGGEACVCVCVCLKARGELSRTCVRDTKSRLKS